MTLTLTKTRAVDVRGSTAARRRRIVEIFRRYRSKTVTGGIYAGDALDFMRSLPSQSARIIFLDPPFNLGKIYGRGGRKFDLRPEAEYQDWLVKVLDES